jgi:phospholipase/carboxylesterase
MRNDGRIKARPRGAGKTSERGSRRLGIGGRRDGVLHVPAGAGDGPLPLLVLLHGAGGNGEGIIRYLGETAENAGVAVLAPDSRGSTWDALLDAFGADVEFLDRALEHTFERVAVDAALVSVGGFSDGATYAISLGLVNGDLFRRVLAFSPGFFVTGPRNGRPEFFVSHGTDDEVLPIRRCSRVIVPRLKNDGYAVTYREFDGGHEVPPTIAKEGLGWLTTA